MQSYNSRFKVFNILFLLLIFHFSFFTFNSNEVGAQPQTTPKPTPLAPKTPPQVGLNLTISPVFVNLATDPGDEISSQLRVTNRNNFREFLRLEVAKFEPPQTGEAPVIVDIAPGDEFANWISFSRQEFVLDPNQTQTIRFTIDPPNDAALGYYYAVIVNRITEQKPGEKAARVTGAPALPVILEVRSPNAKRELQIVDFKTDKMFYEYLPTTFQVTVKNTGNIHIVPSGDIFVDWGSKKDVAIIRANEGRGNILPQATRTFAPTWDDSFAVRTPKFENGKEMKDDKGVTVYTTKFDFTKANKFRVGKYTANLLLVYDNGSRDVPLEATVSFWVVPWKILLGAFILIYFAFLGVKDRIVSAYKRFSGAR